MRTSYSLDRYSAHPTGAIRPDTTSLGVPDTVGRPSLDQTLEMYQKLLTSRFELSFHRSTKEFPVYALELKQDGPKLTKSTGDPDEFGHEKIMPKADGSLIVTFLHTSMPELVLQLMQVVPEQQVVDRTGLKGRYDFELTFSYDPSTPEPDIYVAVQQQLGLKLRRAKAPVEVILIDHVERPSEN